MKYETIKEHYEKKMEVFNDQLLARLEVVVSNLTKSGFKADDYSLGMGSWSIGLDPYYHGGNHDANRRYVLSEMAKDKETYDYFVYAIYDRNDKTYQEYLSDKKIDPEASIKDYPYWDVPTKTQYNWLREFHNICNAYSYGLHQS